MLTVDDIWKRYDTNDDKVLSHEEAKQFFHDYYKEVLNEDIDKKKEEQIFLIIDRSKDGIIQREEMAKYMNLFFNHSQENE